MKNLILIFSIYTVCLVFPVMAISSDLDDGISKYTDDSVAKYDELGKADQNIKFIVLNAKSKASLGNDTGKYVDGGSGKSGDANMNSVILGAGSNISGDIIIIDQSKGSKTNIAQ